MNSIVTKSSLSRSRIRCWRLAALLGGALLLAGLSLPAAQPPMPVAPASDPAVATTNSPPTGGRVLPPGRVPAHQLEADLRTAFHASLWLLDPRS